MRLPTNHDDRRQTDIAMTPMIDVVFQLMIFFICTANFQSAEELLPSNLAITGGTTAPSPIEIEPELERIVVRAAYHDGHVTWTVNERSVPSLPDLRLVLRFIAEIDRTLPVILDVAGEVPLGAMIDVYDLCRLERFEKIQFAVNKRQPDDSAPALPRNT